MKINKPYSVTNPRQIGGANTKGGKGNSVDSADISRPGVKLSGSASFVQTMREAVNATGIRTEVVAQAQEDIQNQTLGTDSDYNQTVTALLVEL